MRCMLSACFSLKTLLTCSSIRWGQNEIKIANKAYICSFFLAIWKGTLEHLKTSNVINTYQIVLVWLSVRLTSSGNVKQNAGESLNGIHEATSHHVSEAHVVVKSDIAGDDLSVETLLVEVNRRENFQGHVVVAQHAVNSAQTNDAEVTEHLEQSLRSKIESFRFVVFNFSTANETRTR